MFLLYDYTKCRPGGGQADILHWDTCKDCQGCNATKWVCSLFIAPVDCITNPKGFLESNYHCRQISGLTLWELLCAPHNRKVLRRQCMQTHFLLVCYLKEDVISLGWQDLIRHSSCILHPAGSTLPVDGSWPWNDPDHHGQFEIVAPKWMQCDRSQTGLAGIQYMDWGSWLHINLQTFEQTSWVGPGGKWDALILNRLRGAVPG